MRACRHGTKFDKSDMRSPEDLDEDSRNRILNCNVFARFSPEEMILSSAWPSSSVRMPPLLVDLVLDQVKRRHLDIGRHARRRLGAPGQAVPGVRAVPQHFVSGLRRVVGDVLLGHAFSLH
jgi:hypothetical protein